MSWSFFQFGKLSQELNTYWAEVYFGMCDGVFEMSTSFWRFTGGCGELQAPSKIKEISRHLLKVGSPFFSFTQGVGMIADLIDEYPMLLLVLEAGVALFILLSIILWTMMTRKK